MQNTSFFQRVKQIQHRHHAICARFLPVILLVGFLLMLSSCVSANNLSATVTPTSRTSTPTIVTTRAMTPTSPSLPPATMNIAPLISLRMIDTMVGWAFTKPNLYTVGGYILRTSDGGHHWQNVSPPYATGQRFDDGKTPEFLSASIAWVVTGRNRVYHTTDGGQTWHSVQLVPTTQGSFATQITFINPLDGWIVFTSNENHGESITLFHTTNGGNSWVSTGVITNNRVNQLPSGVYDWTVGFLNATTGWACGDYPGSGGNANFYVTHDGGTTWHLQMLPYPSGETYTRLAVLAPTFFTATDGLLPALFYNTGYDEGFALYVTHDGGASWQSTTPLTTSISQSAGSSAVAASISLIDMSHVAVIGANGTSLYSTGDGGQHWITIAGNSKYVNLQSLSFVSSTAGWAINQSDFDDSSILQTVDGGHTWTELFRTHLPQS
jgi:photosystem II stability/assembly factor-like uncharacterized protein